MVTSQKTRRIICTVVELRQPTDSRTDLRDVRPSDMLPWADPYIARLVNRLQEEVRSERAVLGGSGVLTEAPTNRYAPRSRQPAAVCTPSRRQPRTAHDSRSNHVSRKDHRDDLWSASGMTDG